MPVRAAQSLCRGPFAVLQHSGLAAGMAWRTVARGGEREKRVAEEAVARRRLVHISAQIAAAPHPVAAASSPGSNDRDQEEGPLLWAIERLRANDDIQGLANELSGLEHLEPGRPGARRTQALLTVLALWRAGRHREALLACQGEAEAGSGTTLGVNDVDVERMGNAVAAALVLLRLGMQLEAPAREDLRQIGAGMETVELCVAAGRRYKACVDAQGRERRMFFPQQGRMLPPGGQKEGPMWMLDGSWEVEDEDADGGAMKVKIGYRLYLKAAYFEDMDVQQLPMLLAYHGNGETAANYAGLMGDRTGERGYGTLPICGVLVADFRGYGWSSPVEPTLASLTTDAAHFVLDGLPGILQSHELSWPLPGGLVLFGRSMGSRVAVHLASVYPYLFRGLILDSARGSESEDMTTRYPETATILKRLGELVVFPYPGVSPPEVRDLGTLEKLKFYTGPLQVLHGEYDDLLPVANGKALFEAAGSPKDKKELVILDGDHNTLFGLPEYWAKTRAFLRRLPKEMEEQGEEKGR